jgi:hypothetical protein
MDNINSTTNNENVLPKFKTPGIFYGLIASIVFFIIVMILIASDFNITSLGSSRSKSDQELISNIFIILFFSLLVFGICIIFLPNFKEFKQLFEQIGNVTFVILYTIFAILFYTMISKDILNNYYYIINPIMLGLGAFSFYKGTSDNYIDKFNVNYERIKMLILLFCLITIVITFYNINPGGSAEKYFGYSMLLTIIISVFAFLYVVVLLTLPDKEGGTQQNLLNNFSSIGSYGTILFLIFLVVVTALISMNKESFFANKNKSASIIIILLIISILWILLLGANLFSNDTFTFSSNVDLTKSSLLILFGFVISGLLIFWISYNIESLSGKSSIVSFVLNMLLVAVILGLIYKTINVKAPIGNSKKNGFFNLIFTILLYIPCLLSGGFDFIGKSLVGHYNAANAGSLIMFVIAICLFILYFFTQSVFNLISTQGGTQLVNRPVHTDSQYNLGSYENLNGSDEFDYQYAISCWIYLDSAGPNMNANYNKYTSLLNFGNKPNVLYNGKTHSFMITMQQKNLQYVTKNKMTDFDSEGNRIIYINDNLLLQKWNNLIINYNGGTMDIFLNGELVKSSIEVVPYYTLDNLTIGENNGIKGGICNVVYFRRALTSQNLYYIYNSLKNMTPPVLNDSNETILVKNINQTISSTENVIN